ncbi:hypothetical protein [Stieleria mannarensis]|uniref:hypothetical protein n=1 Tax=Stieleria mannarensis TaxID=2755585 RepID=UPI001603A6CF|nr:hypothetical protein [Rhodopirellula sp. JC639]
MNRDEKAAMPYQPADMMPAAMTGIEAALAKAEQMLSRRKGVKGMGMTKTRRGQDAIIVYVDQQQTISQLPSDVDGFPIIGDVTGQVRAY